MLEDLKRFVFSRDLVKEYVPPVDHAEGIYIFDVQGNKIMDCSSGWVIAISIGYGIKEVIEAMYKQAQKICFASGIYWHSEPLLKLSEKVASFTPKGLSRSFFINSGSEANETALRIARMYHLKTGNKQKLRVISRWGSYHGATIAALSMTGTDITRRQYYDPYILDFPHIHPSYCYRCPFKKEYPECDVMCARELETVIKHYREETVSAFIADPIAPYLACATPPSEYFPIVREICDKYDVIFIDDEVVTGFGRTGKKMAIDHWGVVPDIIVTAKGMSSGYAPLAAAIVHERIFEEIYKGVMLEPEEGMVLGHTFGGNPLSCAVGLAVLEYIEKNNLVEKTATTGSYLFEQINGRLKDHPWVGNITGKGLLLGIELVADKQTKAPHDVNKKVAETIVTSLFIKGFCVRGGTLPFGTHAAIEGLVIAPPYIIEKAEIDQIVTALQETLLEVQSTA